MAKRGTVSAASRLSRIFLLRRKEKFSEIEKIAYSAFCELSKPYATSRLDFAAI
jgi:hypothetical protein